MIAATVMPEGMPRPMDIPRKATPIIPQVIQEEPVAVESMAHIMSTNGRNKAGEMERKPM